MAPFAADTAPKIVKILGIEITDENLVALRTRLTAIETIDGGSMVPLIESDLLIITNLQTAGSTVNAAKQKQVIQAGKVKFKDSGIGAGAVSTIDEAMLSLGAMLGSPWKEYTTGENESQEPSMYRDDRYSLTGRDGYFADWLFFNY
jgi:hypothetical protein